MIGTVQGDIFLLDESIQVWDKLYTLPYLSQITDFAQDTTGFIYISTLTEGIFQSKDGGSTWIKINQGLSSLRVYSLLCTPQPWPRLLAGTSNNYFMRTTVVDEVTPDKQISPIRISLQDIYPNPFRETTTIKFTLSRPSATLSQNWERVGVRVYDLLGREVKTLFDGEKESGIHTVQFDAKGLPNGLYQVVLQSGKDVARKNVIVMR